MIVSEIRDIVNDTIDKYYPDPCNWSVPFWKGMLQIPEDDRRLVHIRCDNDMTEFYVGEEFPNYKDEEYDNVRNVASPILDGIDLLIALGFKADCV